MAERVLEDSLRLDDGCTLYIDDPLVETRCVEHGFVDLAESEDFVAWVLA